MDVDVALEHLGTLLPVLKQLAATSGPVHIVAINPEQQAALVDLVAGLQVFDEQETPRSESDKQLYAEYVSSFQPKPRPVSRGTTLGRPLATAWLDALRTIRVHQLALRWRAKAARKREEVQTLTRLSHELRLISEWEHFNVFRVSEASNGAPLQVTTMYAFHKLGLIDKLEIPVDTLKAFLTGLEETYKPNPYHNSTHAADVVQVVTATLCMDEFTSQLTDLEVLSLLLAACIHDVAHPGVNNAYLIKAYADMALTYNDNSINENWHLSCAFRILKDHNFLTHLSEADYRFVRRTIIDAVLYTDMMFHQQLLKQFQATMGVLGPNLDNWKDENRVLLLRYVLHACDISNPARPWSVCREWAVRITEENFAQGDREREEGLPVSPLNDRDKANPVKGQQVFCDMFVKPTFQIMAALAPNTAAKALAYAAENSERYEDFLAQGIIHLPDH